MRGVREKITSIQILIYLIVSLVVASQLLKDKKEEKEI